MAPWIKEEYKKDKSSYYLMHYKKGVWYKSLVKPLNELFEYVSSVTNSSIPTDISLFDFSTLTIFKPDNTIFESSISKYSSRELKLAKLMTPSLNILFNGSQIELFDIKKDSFNDVKFINDKIFNFSFELPIDPIENGSVIKDSGHKLKFIAYFGYGAEDFSTSLDGSVNYLDTTEGVHINAIRRSLLRTLSSFNPILGVDECRYGLRLFVLCMSTYPPNYNGQTNERLTNISGFSPDATYPDVYKLVSNLYKENIDYFNFLFDRLIEYKKSIGNLSVKEFVQKEVIMGDDKRSRGLGKKIVECSTRNREEAVLFISEGDSTKGTIINARNPSTQALLP